MILVDSSVWIDLFADRDTPETRTFDRLLTASEVIGVADLVLTEVLQGTRDAYAFDRALTRMSRFALVPVMDTDVAISAARHYQALRARGITVRKTIDVLIAARCITDDIPLLFADRDFRPLVVHCGLTPVLNVSGAA